MTTLTGDVECVLSALYLHPVKSCAGIAVDQALLVETGLEFDRAWMVVDPHGRMLTQRTLPRLALVQPALRYGDMVLRAPGMLALHVRLDTVEAATRVQVWDDVVKAYDMGALAAQWFSDFLGCAARLVRFDPDEQRLSSRQWAGPIDALNAFADGFPLLVVGAASLAGLNGRLQAAGAAAVAMTRFRPNIVLSGLQAHDEDHLHEIDIDVDSAGANPGTEAPVTLRLVKPCVRCGIPNVDPATAAVAAEPGATLATYRADPRMQGGITFGVNAVVVSGCDRSLRVGQRVVGRWRFD